MTKPIVYLAGAIDGLTYKQACGWREQLTERLDHAFNILSPMRGKEALRGSQELSGAYPEHLLSRAGTIVLRDLTDVGRADLLIVHGLQGSLGTAIEVGYAIAKQKPIIVIEALYHPVRHHPFVQYCPQLVLVENFEDAAVLACSLFNL